MIPNRIREKLKNNKPTIATGVVSPWPGYIEILGNMKIYDYVEWASQYSPYDLHDFDNLARAADATDISLMIKVDQEPKTYLAERALAAGIQNVLFADIRSVEDAKEAVRAVRPEHHGGIMGVGQYRTLGYLTTKTSVNNYIKTLDDAVVALMIEKKGAVENIEEILSVKGVDMVQFGPSDYSISLGMPGKTTHPDVIEAELKTIETALKLDVAPRAEINNIADAKKYLDLGVKHFSIGTDLEILDSTWREQGSSLADVLSTI
tara:strand:+ start:189 stop:977 length:789 start_codon:yes stop_codon:yes gene_type:complete